MRERERERARGYAEREMRVPIVTKETRLLRCRFARADALTARTHAAARLDLQHLSARELFICDGVRRSAAAGDDAHAASVVGVNLTGGRLRNIDGEAARRSRGYRWPAAGVFEQRGRWSIRDPRSGPEPNYSAIRSGLTSLDLASSRATPPRDSHHNKTRKEVAIHCLFSLYMRGSCTAARSWALMQLLQLLEQRGINLPEHGIKRSLPHRLRDGAQAFAEHLVHACTVDTVLEKQALLPLAFP